MYKKNIKDIIDHSASAVVGEERLVRLLCSPLYYDKETGIVNPDAFDLRMLGRNKDVPETYASLGRKLYLDTKEKFDEYVAYGYKIKWPEYDPQNVYVGYGEFLCGKALQVHDMVKIYPLNGGVPYHIGLFYAKSDGTFYKGPLPKTDAEILEVLSDLSDLLDVTEICQ